MLHMCMHGCTCAHKETPCRCLSPVFSVFGNVQQEVTGLVQQSLCFGISVEMSYLLQLHCFCTKVFAAETLLTLSTVIVMVYLQNILLYQ